MHSDLSFMETCACPPASLSKRTAGARLMALLPVDHDPGGLPGGQGPVAQSLPAACGDGIFRIHGELSHSASLV